MLDRYGEVLDLYQVQNLPITYLLNKDGVIEDKIFGEMMRIIFVAIWSKMSDSNFCILNEWASISGAFSSSPLMVSGNNGLLQVVILNVFKLNY